jgi:hypothetical protein
MVSIGIVDGRGRVTRRGEKRRGEEKATRDTGSVRSQADGWMMLRVSSTATATATGDGDEDSLRN